jgi:hypothetical protein
MERRSLSLRLLVGVLATAMAIGCEPEESTGRVREIDLPIGFLDLPTSGTLVTGDLFVTGWALSADGIEDVAVYANGRYVDSAVLGFARPDVAEAEPGMAGAATSGFQLVLPAQRLPGGEVTLVVQARTRRGATRDLGAQQVVVPRPE